MNGTDELNLEQLTSDVKTAEDALPCNLSDDWLDKIAQDLEALFDEESQAGKVEPNLSASAALFLILHILEYKEEKAGNFSGEIEVRTEDLFGYFRDYRLEVSLERVSRQTDIRAESATLETIFTDRKVMFSRDKSFPLFETLHER